MKYMKKGMVVLAIIVLLLGTGAWYVRKNGEPDVRYRTAPVTRGDIRVTISATGTVEPEEVIDVGARVAGQILSFGKDVDGNAVDYGSTIQAGTVLARIDDSLYRSAEAQAEAQVKSARAGLQRAQADLVQMKSKFRQAQLDWKRAQKLGPSEALAQSSYDAYQSAYETAQANVSVGDAAILQAEAAVAQAEAGLEQARQNLGYCTITSPVNGVIIDRRVNIGQTVVASLNAPSLFLIAKDLTRMQVWVAVNEADIGKIRPGQPVTFTVDAFPGETFTGTVRKVRLNASMTQNVVTYTVEITTDNSSGRLLPYLTANVAFEIGRVQDVLQVPNTALRWSPSADQVAPALREDFTNASESAASPEQGGGPRTGQVWVLKGPYVEPVQVSVGLSDGAMTAISGNGISEGTNVVTGIQSQQSADQSDARNPFAPQFRRRSSSGKSK